MGSTIEANGKEVTLKSVDCLYVTDETLLNEKALCYTRSKKLTEVKSPAGF